MSNTEFSEVYSHLLFLYEFVSNGKIVIKYIFSCVHQTNIKSNDKFTLVEAHMFDASSDKA